MKQRSQNISLPGDIFQKLPKVKERNEKNLYLEKISCFDKVTQSSTAIIPTQAFCFKMLIFLGRIHCDFTGFTF